MSPPTEQLIRDYLNRLSVAARDRLGPADRRALVDRTRKLIERRSDFAGRPTLLEVGKVLARLGDPAVLVEQECRRLGALRGDVPGGGQHSGPAQLPDPAVSLDLAELTDPGSRGFLSRVLRREPGRAWRARSGWLVAVPTENGVSDSVASASGAPAPGPMPLTPQWPAVVATEGGGPVYPPRDLLARNGTTAGAGLAPADPGDVGQGSVGEDGGWEGDSAEGDAAAAAVSDTSDTSDTNSTNETNRMNSTNGTATLGSETAEEFDFVLPAPTVPTRAVRLIGRLASVAWEQPLEATAIILLGLGGVIFPPVFVLGALVALGSKLWHYRDKWAGLALPPVLTIIAVAAAVAAGGRSHGLHDGWVCLNIVSRLAALLGAGYLAWRTGRGRRPPPAPPWHVPDRPA